VDFGELIRDPSPLAADDWPTIVGGACEEDELLGWLQRLDLAGMDVRIWTFTDHATIGTAGPPEAADRLERARLFGAAGDLDIRRDGRRFLWRYVGESDNAPEGTVLPWPGTAVDPIYRREATALLWGKREGAETRWFDDRVAGADLTYPVEGVPERVQVRYWEYTQAGRTLAVWMEKLEAYDG
jgi:hypothetical protein